MNKTKSISLNNVIKIGILAALAFILMFFQIPIPIAPPFMKVDLADVPALIGGFAMGPVAGVLIQLVKNILNLTKTQTVGVGELSNFIVGATFVFVSASIYKNKKTKKDRKSTRLNSSHVSTSYAVYSLKKKNNEMRMCTNDS